MSASGVWSRMEVSFAVQKVTESSNDGWKRAEPGPLPRGKAWLEVNVLEGWQEFQVQAPGTSASKGPPPGPLPTRHHTRTPLITPTFPGA